MAPLPAINAPVQQAPLMRLGGEPSALDQMIQQRLATLQGTDLSKDYANVAKMNAYGGALKDLPLLQALANTKSQDRTLQAQYHKELATQLEKFTALPPEQQAVQRPFMMNYMRNTAKLAGMEGLSDEDISHALTSPNLAGTYASIVNDPLVDPQTQQAALARIGAAKPGKERDDAAALISKEVEQRAQSLITTALPQVAARLGATPDKPITMQQLMADPDVKKYLDQSPVLRRTFNAYVTNKDNAATLAGFGIKPGTVDLKAMEQTAAGPALSAGVKDFLATLKSPDGKPITEKNATAEQIAWAQNANAKFEIKKAASQGLAVEEYKRTLPAPGEELSKYVDVGALVKTGALQKPRPGTSVADLYSNPNLRYATPEQQQAVQALEPTRQSIAAFQTLGDRLITASTPAQAAVQGAKLYAGAFTGANPEAKAFLDSSMGFIGNISRTLGAEKGVLTDTDRMVMRNAAVASFFDTKQSMEIKKAIINDMYKSAHKAAIGIVAGTTTGAEARTELEALIKRLDSVSTKAVTSSLRSDQMAIRNTQTGEIKVGAKGTKVPSGWEEVK